MVEVSKPDQQLRFRNVIFHSQGTKEQGTLYLYRHHLLFSYAPRSTEDERILPGPHGSLPSQSTASSKLTETSHSGDSGSLPSASDPATGTSNAPKSASDSHHERKDSRPRPRPKEIWLPYPMINQCVLRPSHLQAQTSQTREDPRQSQDGEDGELFPPTIGTASYGRPSTDSAHLAPFSSPQRPSSPNLSASNSSSIVSSGRQPAIRIRSRDSKMMALHFHASQSGTSADEIAREVFYVLRSRCCVEKVDHLHAFHFKPPKSEGEAGILPYDARREYARMGIGSKAADGPGTAWRISDINRDYSYSATYPSVLCVPRTVSDNMLKYGGVFRSRSRIPCLAYLHHNGGSITRSSQPMVGVQNKRNPQDERLVSAIFSSHTPPFQSPEASPPQLPSIASPSASTLDSTPSEAAAAAADAEVPSLKVSQSDTALDEKMEEKATPVKRKIYGSTRRNLIVDARPKINALANRATGGGIEDVANYTGNNGMPVEKVFLNIANIHVMRSSLEKVFESFANSDYIKMKADQEALRKSGWLGHIANMIDGAEMVARVVGLGGSHVLVHCSDGWDRTAQISALAQIMLDPYYRTLEGFITLVQKDFLSFGHKFRDRNGIEGSEKWFEIENERIAPSRNRETNNSDPNSLNALGNKALAGAKSWFEKNRGSLFRQQNTSKDSLGEQPSSRPPSPPPNPLLHSPPSSTSKEEKEHRISEKEISPIFHQFLDAIYQLQYQYPHSFEFNERFLRRLFYHMYACQYGEFLFNTERERVQQSGKVPSVWPHFFTKRTEFINPGYNVDEKEDQLLFAKRTGPEKDVEVRWWHSLFGREDEEMNTPRALAPSDPPTMTATTAATAVEAVEKQNERQGRFGERVASSGTIKESKSTPNLEASAAHMTAERFEAMSVKEPSARFDDDEAVAVEYEDPGVENASAGKSSIPTPASKTFEYDGDPLGVTASSSPSSQPTRTASERLDFAAFASQNAFRD